MSVSNKTVNRMENVHCPCNKLLPLSQQTSTPTTTTQKVSKHVWPELMFVKETKFPCFFFYWFDLNVFNLGT